MFRSIFLAFALLGALSASVFSSGASAEEWTNLHGTNTVSADLIGVWNGRALLRLDSGRQVSVKLDDLNAISRIKAQDMQEEIDKRLVVRVAELDAIATEAAASAPATRKSPKPAPAYAPPQDGADLQTWLDHVQTQAKAGHFRVYFDSLPKSQQAQAEELFKFAMDKLDANNWELVRSTLMRASELVVNKQRWLFSHPKLETTSDADRESMLLLASAFQKWGTPENASFEKLRTGTLSDALASLDDAASAQIHELIIQNSLIAALVFPSYQSESEEGGKMIAKITLPIVGTLQSVPMVQIEGQWTEGATPEEAQAKWDGYKKSLEAIAKGSVRLGTVEENLLRSFAVLMGKLESATSRNAFHRTIDDSAPELTLAINAWAGLKSQTNSYEGYDGSSDYGASDPSGAMREQYEQQNRSGPP